MNKISMSEAKKLSTKNYHIMHIEWFSENSGYKILFNKDLEKEYPDCSHVLLLPNTKWLQSNNIFALILKEENRI